MKCVRTACAGCADSADSSKDGVSIESSSTINTSDAMPRYYGATTISTAASTSTSSATTTTNHNNNTKNSSYKSPPLALASGSFRTHITPSFEETGRQTADTPMTSPSGDAEQPPTIRQPAAIAASSSQPAESVSSIAKGPTVKPSPGVSRTAFRMQSSFDGNPVTQSKVAAALSAFEQRRQVTQQTGGVSTDDGSCSSSQRSRIAANAANAETASSDRPSIGTGSRVGLLARGLSIPESALSPAAVPRSTSVKRRAPVAPPVGVPNAVARHHGVVGPQADAKPQPQQQMERAQSHDSEAADCCLCFERPRDTVIYRCGHVCLCYECALEIREFHKPPLCPICRQTISDIIKIYKA